MEQKRHYMFAIPKITELRTAYYLLISCSFTILMIVYFLRKGSVFDKLTYFSIIFLFLLIVGRVVLIRLVVINRTDSVLKENLTLSNLGDTFKDALLYSKDNYSRFRKKEKIIKIFIIISIILVFKLIGSDPLYKFHITWLYSLISMSMLLFFVVLNVYKYFTNVVELLLKINKFRIYCSQLSFIKHDVLSTMQQNISKSTKLLFFSIFLIVIIALMFISFNMQAGITFLPIILIVALGIIVLDLNKVIDVIVPIMGQYDSYIKNELGLVFQQSSENTGFSEISDEMSKNVKDFFK